MKLTDVQARILGSLIEKEITTPENYPLSLNALRNACNQSSSREPVMTLAEDEVRQGFHVLEDMGLADSAHDARVPKYEHRVRDRLQLRRDETAVLCLLLLRGPQTPGELRTRSERMYSFDDPASVVTTLQRLASRTEEEHPDGPLTLQLARQPGARESRWTQLLSGSAETAQVVRVYDEPRVKSGLAEEIEALRDEVRVLRERLDRLEGIG
jgi:uncharacterized protein YceH (UPF0502 family)